MNSRRNFHLLPLKFIIVKMADFSAQEYFDMLITYAEAGQSAYRASILYQEKFPGRRIPAHNVFVRLVSRAFTTGSLMPSRKDVGAGRDRTAITPENVEAVLHAIGEDPTTSIRALSRMLAIHRNSVHRILRENRMHPYHYRRVQSLMPQDYPRRIEFCTWLLENERREPGFVHRILFTDESHFTREGTFNSHNSHIWSNENPHAYHVRGFQHRFSINLWAGVINNRMIGPFSFPPRLNGNIYSDFITNELQVLLEDLPLADRLNMIFQHDGAPPHITRGVKNTLDEAYPNRWIGRGGPINWPARSPDLTPMDFFFWGHLKEYVYQQEEIRNEEELHNRIIEGLATITEEMIIQSGRNLLKRARLCIQMEGGHFEHLL